MPRRPAKKQAPQKSQSFDLVPIKPLTENQEKAFSSYAAGKNLFLHGFPGTGKSFISLYLSLEEFFKTSNYQKILIVRSIVPGRDIGFLPGNVKEKTEIYELPYANICNELLSRGDGYSILKQKFMIEFSTTSFLRSITWKDSLVIMDEVQNFMPQEMHTCMSRVGENCRIVLCGDYSQIDLKRYEESCIHEILKITEEMSSFETIKMDIDDVVRSGFAKEYLLAKHKIDTFSKAYQ